MKLMIRMKPADLQPEDDDDDDKSIGRPPLWSTMHNDGGPGGRGLLYAASADRYAKTTGRLRHVVTYVTSRHIRCKSSGGRVTVTLHEREARGNAGSSSSEFPLQPHNHKRERERVTEQSKTVLPVQMHWLTECM